MTYTPSEWDNVKNMTDVLKFFYEATLDLSYGDASISIVIPLISLLNRKLQTRDDNDNDAVTLMKKQLHESMNKRFAYVKGHPLLITATLLDPRFKSKYLNSDEIDIVIDQFDHIVEFMKSQDRRQNQVQRHHMPFDEPSTSSVQSDKEEGLWDTHDNNPDKTTSDVDTDDHASVIRQTVQCYLSEPRLQRNADIYSYWNSSPYPLLRKAVLKYLSVPPTSVPSEQLFSAAGQIYADRRCNLLGENAEKLLFLTYNIRLFDFNY